jgi:hypothetical protein
MKKLWGLWILIGIIAVVMVMACGGGSEDEAEWRVPSQHPTPGHVEQVGG